MKIEKTIEMPNGSVRFAGELSQEEVDFVLQLGLTGMLAAGMIPYTVKYDEEDYGLEDMDVEEGVQ